MEATKLKNLKDENVFTVGNMELLTSAVIYGANASGKSNFIKAFGKMKNIIKNNSDLQKIKHYPHEPFLLDLDTKESPTKFEIEIIIDEVRYRYGFIISQTAQIEKEWLYSKNLKAYAKEAELFSRKNSTIELNQDYKDSKILIEKTSLQALFLVVTAQFNNQISKKIYDWFDKALVFSNLNAQALVPYTFEKLKEPKYKEKITNLIKSLDFGISDIVSKEISFEDIQKNIPAGFRDLELLPKEIKDRVKVEGITKIDVIHAIYKDDEFIKYEDFELDFESDGTQKLLMISAPIVDSLLEGNVIFIDELDNSLHTDLVRAIVMLYNNKNINTKNAQLIFSTHDTNLLDQELFRRDQIWFAQKDIYGKSELYSLVEFGKGKLRDDLVLEKNYISGKFGAKPNIGNIW
ncbi:MAG: ATP-binding protein [Sulfuricurvum sp.]